MPERKYYEKMRLKKNSTLYKLATENENHSSRPRFHNLQLPYISYSGSLNLLLMSFKIKKGSLIHTSGSLYTYRPLMSYQP